jgi:hypothetical protein
MSEQGQSNNCRRPRSRGLHRFAWKDDRVVLGSRLRELAGAGS